MIVCTLEFLLSSVVPGLIWKLVEFLLRGFGGRIIPKLMGDKFVGLNNCSLLEINLCLDWLTRRDRMCGLN